MGRQNYLEVHYLPSNFGRKVKFTNFGRPNFQTRILLSVDFVPKFAAIRTAQKLACSIAKELTNLAHSKPIDSTVRKDPDLVSLIREAVESTDL